ncbi:MAG: sterol desaturase family protein [Pseudomonadota bacterium]
MDLTALFSGGFSQAVSDHEGAIRLTVAGGLFAILAVSEWLKPRRRLVVDKSRRWSTNLAIIVLDSALVRLLFPAAAVGVALWAQSAGIGLFNWLDTPLWLAVLVSFVVLDFAVWASHVLSHKVPLFWRFHRMHHADRDIDVTTGLRFHPIEIIGSMLWKVGFVILLGAPAIAVVLFEIVLNGTAMFNHSNTKLPLKIDRVLRLVLVTPDMHRVHHSAIGDETDSNYGFNLPWWDRMFGTYIDQPALGHDGMTIGLDEWQDERPSRLGWSLALPFGNPASTASTARDSKG